MAADLCGFQLGGVSPSHRVGDLLQNQSHSVGILLQLLDEVRSAPTHLPKGAIHLGLFKRSFFFVYFK